MHVRVILIKLSFIIFHRLNGCTLFKNLVPELIEAAPDAGHVHGLKPTGGHLGEGQVPGVDDFGVGQVLLNDLAHVVGVVVAFLHGDVVVGFAFFTVTVTVAVVTGSVLMRFAVGDLLIPIWVDS